MRVAVLRAADVITHEEIYTATMYFKTRVERCEEQGGRQFERLN